MFIITYTNEFLRSYKKLPLEIKTLVEQKEKIIRENPFDQRLHTHKLEYKLKRYWSLSVNYQYRIIFTFEGNKLIMMHNIGNHDIYTKFFK
jgi:addiction module RelE/StbE family toxin